NIMNTDVKDAVYVTIKRPRVRALYLDQVQEKTKNGVTKPNGEVKPTAKIDPKKIDIVE
ncbi:hypothetical protein LCGC14_3106490, partial [marine sediment metagenome]